MIPCSRHRQSIALMTVGALDEPEVKFLEYHLDNCADCRAYAQRMTLLCRGLAVAEDSIPPMEPPPGLAEQIQRRVREEAGQGRPRIDIPFLLRRWLPWPRLALAAPAVLLCLIILQWAMVAMRPRPEIDPSPSSRPLASVNVPESSALPAVTLANFNRALRQSLTTLEEELDRNERLMARGQAATTILGQRNLSLD